MRERDSKRERVGGGVIEQKREGGGKGYWCELSWRSKRGYSDTSRSGYSSPSSPWLCEPMSGAGLGLGWSVIAQNVKHRNNKMSSGRYLKGHNTHTQLAAALLQRHHNFQSAAIFPPMKPQGSFPAGIRRYLQKKTDGSMSWKLGFIKNSPIPIIPIRAFKS